VQHRGTQGRAAYALRIAFLLSGGSALLFETLWFRQAGLLLGNALWTSTIVLGAFMAGLALGNALAGQLGPRVRSPVLVYQVLELVVGSAGLGLVLLLPRLTPALVPLLHATLEWPALLNGVRLAAAFLLMVVPATAMGATLPLLVRASWSGRVGTTLGHLYGWNTLGAVLGTLAGEVWLIGWLGVTGTALVATTLNVAAAAIAGVAGRSAAPRVAETPWRAALPRAGRLLLASFLSGAALLALEVVWFRFLLLHVVGTSLSFALMLAVVLLGIAAGGLAAGWYTSRSASAHESLPKVALAAGMFVVLGYAVERDVLQWLAGQAVALPLGVAALALPLMLPTCVMSGMIFTFLGAALEERGDDPGRAAAGVTLTNTLGACGGAFAGGWVLLPALGIERALFLLVLIYALVAVCTLSTRRESRVERAGTATLGLAAAAYLALLALFPFGLMRNHYLPMTISRAARTQSEGVEVLATREGLTETLAYVRHSLWGTPVRYQLLTNAISMSAFDTSFTRYMRAFVYLPVAINPEAKRALLISYGVGVTAKSLVDTPGLTTIDVVDISPDILELGRLVFPAPDSAPLDDPRVRVHLEDGRFFLLTTRERYDIITAEPPPPKSAGIVNLYSREYFQLLYERLADAGVATYWLPAYQLEAREAKAVTRAFCDAFADCSLWSGFGPELVLMGTRGVRQADEESFTRQWREPRALSALRDVALERPEDLGTLFMADAPTLEAWTRGVDPVDDDHPHRISPALLPLQSASYFPLADLPGTAQRFAQSAFIRAAWPAALRERTLRAFAEQAPLLRASWVPYGVGASNVVDLHAVLTRRTQRTAVLWLLGTDAASERAAVAAQHRGIDEPLLDELLAASAFADRDYLRAEALLAKAQPKSRSPATLLQRRVLALCLAGERQRATAILQEASGWLRPSQDAGWTWLIETFELPAERG
jgi:spermidine synthase